MSSAAVTGVPLPDSTPPRADGASTSLVDDAPTVGVKEIFRRFWPETKGLRLRLFVSLVFVIVGPALDTASIYLFKVLVDDVFTPGDFSLFPLIAAAYLGITVLEGLIGFVDSYLITWVGEQFLLRLRTKLFAHLHRLSLGFFERRQLGDVLSRLTGDIAAIESLVLSGVGDLLSHVLKLLFFGGMLFWLNWKLALVSLVAAPLFALVARRFGRRIKKASREKRRRAGAIGAVAEESLNNVALVQAYDRAGDEVERFHGENLGSFRAQMVATRLQSTFSPILDVLEVAAILLVMGFAVWELAAGRLTLGGLLAFIAYLTQLYGPVRGLGSLYNSIYAASAGAERVIELLDEKPLVVDPVTPTPLARARGSLTVEAAHFAYPGTDRAALTDVSFTVAPGQKVAIVGASGAGKSSLAKLLLRTYDPDQGRLTLDGVDLRSLALSDLRRNVTAVLQETLVFDGSIRDNILWGRPGATEDDVIAAARAADAHDFVVQLPDGYDTRVGQRGRMLSGGQRQRLAIARAMIRDAPVLVLDEPTTGLDAASSQRVLAPLRRLMSGRTTVIISHNLLTVTDADRIVYLESGRITGSGTHEQLLAGHAGYAELYRLHHASSGSPTPTPTRPRPRPVGAPSPVPRPRVAEHDADATVTAALPLPSRRPRPWAVPVAPRNRTSRQVDGFRIGALHMAYLAEQGTRTGDRPGPGAGGTDRHGDPRAAAVAGAAPWPAPRSPADDLGPPVGRTAAVPGRHRAGPEPHDRPLSRTDA